jgi:hypothetical protein
VSGRCFRQALVEADEGRRICFQSEREVQRVERAQWLVSRRQEEAFRTSMRGRRQFNAPE